MMDKRRWYEHVNKNMEIFVGGCNIHGKQDGKLLFVPDILIQVLQELIAIILDTALSEGSGSSVAGNIQALARLDGFTATVLTCLQEKSSESHKGHRQKL